MFSACSRLPRVAPIARPLTTPLVRPMLGSLPSRSFLAMIDTATVGIKQTFGAAGGMFTSGVTLEPGLHIYMPIFQSIDSVSTRLTQNNFQFEVKTKGLCACLFCANLGISVQWRVKPSNVEKAYFSLDSPDDQIRSYVENVVRARAPTLLLEELFAAQDTLAENVLEVLSDKMESHGFTIVDTLVTEIDPEKKVKDAMNEINQSARLKEAAKNKADAAYITRVRDAEADAERKKLQGKGMADLRAAVLDGYKEGVKSISDELDMKPREILKFVQNVQQMDMLETVGRSDNTKVIFMESDPTSSSPRKALIEALEATKKD